LPKMLLEPYGLGVYEVIGDEKIISRMLEKSLYGKSDDVFHVDYLEVLYHLYRGAIIVKEGDKQLSFYDLVSILSKYNENIWVVFEVFLDIRRRGRVVKSGVYESSLIVQKGNDIIEYHIMEESKLVKVSEIERLVLFSRKNNREPVLAIVDRNGNLTYYAVERIRLPKIS